MVDQPRSDEERRPAPVKRPQGSPAVAEADADEGIGLLVLGILAAVLAVVLPLGITGGLTADSDVEESVAEAEEPTTTEVETATTTEAAAETTTTTSVVVSANAVVTMSDDGAVLSGTVIDESTGEILVSVVENAYGGSGVVNELATAPDATIQEITITGQVSDTGLYEGAQAATEQATVAGYSVTNSVELIEGGGDDLETSLNELVSLEPILFEDGTAQIIPASLPILDEAAAILADYPDANVEVQGHTDSRGDAAANEELSQRRADAVVAALQERGVATNLTAVGKGESELEVDPEVTEEDYQANRRIVFKVN